MIAAKAKHHDVDFTITATLETVRTHRGRPWPPGSFFHIKAAYFTDDEYLRKLDRIAVAVRDDDGVRRIAQRAHRCPPRRSLKVLDRIDELRRAEGSTA